MAGILWRKATVAHCWRSGERWVSFWRCLSWTQSLYSWHDLKVSSTLGWTEPDAGGSSLVLWLECPESFVGQDGGE